MLTRSRIGRWCCVDGDPDTVAVPTYLNSLRSDIDRSHDARDEDLVFFLQVANRTVEKIGLAMYGRIMQIAWVLAAKMEQAKELRQCLYNGLAAIGSYIAEKPQIPFDDEVFEELSPAMVVARDILENSGEIKRAQAGAAVSSGRGFHSTLAEQAMHV